MRKLKLAKEFENGMSLSCSSVTGSSDLLYQDVLSLESSDPADSMLLAQSSQDEVDVVGEGEYIAFSEPSQPISPAYEEFLEVMVHTTTRLGR